MAQPKLFPDLKLNAVRDFMQDDSLPSGMESQTIQQISVNEVYTFQGYPIHVRPDSPKAREIFESIKTHGVLTPIILRARPSGGYELLAGEHRWQGAITANLELVPAVIKQYTDEDAETIYLESNKQREEYSRCELAQIFSVEMNRIRRKAGRPTDNSRTEFGNYQNELANDVAVGESADIIGEKYGISGRQVQDYLRLNLLIPDIQIVIDEKKIGIKTGVSLSWLAADKQSTVWEYCLINQCYPSAKQGVIIRKSYEQKKLTPERLAEIMKEVSAPIKKRTSKTGAFSCFQSFFPKEYTEDQIKSKILELLDEWKSNH